MKDKKIKIGFDLDGVLIDHKKNRKILACRRGYRGVFEKTPVPRLKKIISPEDYRKIQGKLYGRMTLRAKPMRDALWVLEKLSRDFEIFIISRRRAGHIKFARLWLEKHAGFLPSRNFFADSDKSKGLIVKKLGVKIFLDDKISVLKLMPKGIKKFLFDEYHKTKKIGDINVVYSFKAFLKAVNRHSGKFSKNRIG